MKKIALYFGSFNPPHIGHTMIANYILLESEIDELWFVVSPKNPFKDKTSLIDSRTRLEMTRVAIGDYPRMRVCDIELSLPQPSYTITTLRELNNRYPDYKFAIIMGSDNLENFHKWKEYEKILDNYTIYVYPRPEHDGGKFTKHKSVHKIKAPQIEISSSYIREHISTNKDVRFFLREEVFKQIEKEGLYQKK